MTQTEELERIIEEQEIPERLATPQLCKKYGYEVLIGQNTHCGVTYDCLYKAENSQICMNQEKINLWKYKK